MRKLEEISEQTAATLSVIHRFMSLHSNVDSTDFPGGDSSSGGITGSTSGPLRLRRASEHSESEVSLITNMYIIYFNYSFSYRLLISALSAETQLWKISQNN